MPETPPGQAERNEEVPPMHRILAAVAAGSAFWLAANAGYAGTPSSTGLFEEKVQPIFDDRCVLCHMAGAENAGLALEAGRSLTALVGVQSTESKLLRISPGEPDKSYLIQKLKGTQLNVGGQGKQMPLDMGQLSPDEIAAIEAWIRSLPKS